MLRRLLVLPLRVGRGGSDALVAARRLRLPLELSGQEDGRAAGGRVRVPVAVLGRLGVVGLHVRGLHVVVVGLVVAVAVAGVAGRAGEAAGAGFAGDALFWNMNV